MILYKSQSATEYLMTYGWAVLIIGIVLGAIFGLGFFNSASLSPKVGPGSCQIYRPGGPESTSFINIEGTCNNELPQYAGKFNGQSSSVSAGATPSVSTSVTLEAWIELLSLGTQEEIVSRPAPSSDVLEIEGSNTIRFNIALSSSNLNFQTGSSVLSVGQWYNIIATYNNGVGIIYVNGVQKASGGGSGTMSDTAYSWSIGNLTSVTPGRPFNGLISNVQIYNASLTANEVTALYIEGIGGVPLNLNSLVGWWPLNGNANDYSGNLNNGVPTRVVYTSSWTNSYSAP